MSANAQPDIPHLIRSGRMTAARASLLEDLQRVADGEDIVEAELEAAVPDPFMLDPAEKNAWEDLSHWADDDDIRERDEHYAALEPERMRSCCRSDGEGPLTPMCGRLTAGKLEQWLCIAGWCGHVSDLLVRR